MKYMSYTRVLAGCLLCVLLVGIYYAHALLNRDLISEAEQRMKDTLYRMLTPEMQELARQQAHTRLLEEHQKQEALVFWGNVRTYGTISTISTVLFAVLSLSVSACYRLTTHTLKTKHSHIEYRGRLDPSIASGIVLAEQLEARCPEQAIKLYLDMAQVNQKLLTGVLHRPSSSPQSDQPPPCALPPKIPTFRDLLDTQMIAPGKPLVFGFTQDGQPKTGKWEDAYSCGIGGQSGFGKSSTIRSLVAQSLLNGSVDTFFVIDPHYPHRQSLLASLGILKDSKSIHYAENPFDTKTMIEEIESCIERRIQGKEKSFPLKIVVIDEIMTVLRSVPHVQELIEKIGCESRKAGVYGIFSSPSWVSSKTGGTTARDNLTTIFAHRMKKKQAFTLLQDTDAAKQVVSLGKGHALFAPVASEPEILQIPFCQESDMKMVAERYMAYEDRAGGDKIQNEYQSEGSRQRNAVETIAERQETEETPFLFPAGTLRQFVDEQIETGKETLSGLAKKIDVNKGQFYRFLRKDETPSESIQAALSLYKKRAETPLETR